MISATEPRHDASLGFRAVHRALSVALDDSSSTSPDDPPSLESQRLAPADPPRIAGASLVEGNVMMRRVVPGGPEEGFAAFLDGIQRSRVVLHDGTVPIIHGVIGAVVRERVDRRLATWQHASEQRLYVPRAFVSSAVSAALGAFGANVTDTTPRKGDAADEEASHPLALADVAVSAVQAHRESLELRLAEQWSDTRAEPLYVDGGISANTRLAAAPTVIGVVKSHRTLYGDPAAVRVILSLRAGERSSVFTVSSPAGWRSPVSSWYLRLRDGGDPLWGLVRVETATIASDHASAADRISRWVLAETAPIAMPDSRWDTMAYGIRDCEQFLRSILL